MDLIVDKLQRQFYLSDFEFGGGYTVFKGHLFIVQLLFLGHQFIILGIKVLEFQGRIRQARFSVSALTSKISWKPEKVLRGS